MNLNNCSLFSKNNLEVVVEDINASNDEELEKLKNDNFQLRLKCYNYEVFMNKFESQSNDQDEIKQLKRDLFQRIENFNEIEDENCFLKQENFDLKRIINQSAHQLENFKTSNLEKESQCEMECIICAETKSKYEREIELIHQNIEILEKENLELKASLQEAKQLLIKPKTKNNAMSTEIYLPFQSDFLLNHNELFNESSELGVNEVDSQFLLNQILAKLNLFMENHINEDKLFNQIESSIIASMKIHYPIDLTCNEIYRLNLYKNFNGYLEDREITKAVWKVKKKLVDDEVDLFISGYIEDSRNSVSTIVNKENPNELIINSVLDKIQSQNSHIENIKMKCKINYNWSKNISTAKPCKEEMCHSINDVYHDYDVYCDKISIISNDLLTMIPMIKTTFSNTINRLKMIKSHLFDCKEFSELIDDQHEKNERQFFDYCNNFIQSATDCINMLNNEKMMCNKIEDIFNFESENRKKNDINESVVEVINDELDNETESRFECNNKLYVDRASSPFVCGDADTRSVLTQTDLNEIICEENVNFVIEKNNTSIQFEDIENELSYTSSEVLKSQNTFSIDNKRSPKKLLNSVICAAGYGDVPSQNDNSSSTTLADIDNKLIDSTTVQLFVPNIRRCQSLDIMINNQSIHDSISQSCLNANNSNHNLFVDENKKSRNLSTRGSKPLKPKPRKRISAQNETVSPHAEIIKSFLDDSFERMDYHLENKRGKTTKHTGKIDINEIMSYLQLRMIKLILIHDLRKYINAASRKDAQITDEYASLSEKIMDHNSSEVINESRLFLESRQILEKWKRELESFNSDLEQSSQVPSMLLAVSDHELIKFSFVQGDSKLDFPVYNGDIYMDTDKLFGLVENTIEEMAQKFSILEKLYFQTMTRKEQLMDQLKNGISQNTSEIILKLQTKITKLESDCQKYEYQYKNALMENEKIETHIEQIKTKTKEYVKNIIEERDELREVLDKTFKEKAMLHKAFDESHESYDKAFQELEQLKIENADYLNRITELNRESNKLSHELNNLELDNKRNVKQITQLSTNLYEFKEKFPKINVKVKELEKINSQLRQKEKHMALDIKRKEQGRLKKDEEISKLTKERDDLKKKISEFDAQLQVSLNDYNTKIHEYEYTMSKLMKDGMNNKNVKEVLTNELNQLTEDVGKSKVEIMHFKELNESLRFQIGELNSQLEEKEKSINDLHKKTLRSDNNILLIDQAHQKLDSVIHSTIEFIKKANVTSKDLNLQTEFEIQPNWSNLELEETRKLKSIQAYLDVLHSVIVKQQKMMTTMNHLTTSSLRNKYIQTESIITDINEDNNSENKKEVVPENRNKHSEKDRSSKIEKHKHHRKSDKMEKMVDGVKELPIPPPRRTRSSGSSRKTLTLKCNEFGCSNQVKTALGINKNKNNTLITDQDGVEIIYDSDTIENIEEHSMVLSYENSNNKESNICLQKSSSNVWHNRSNIPIENGSNVYSSREIVEVEIENESKAREILKSILSKFNSENCDLEILDNDDISMLQTCLKGINTDVSNLNLQTYPQYTEVAANSNNEEHNLDKLISTNRDLTQSLIKTTNKLLNLQKNHEILTTELRHCQNARSEISKELVEKYEKIKNLEIQCQINHKETRSIQAQTVGGNNNMTMEPYNHISIENKESNIIVPHSIVSNNITKSDEIFPRPISQSYSEYTPFLNRSTVRVHQDGDWEDVTRTMIKCLTTLSEVQESLLTPSIDGDSSLSYENISIGASVDDKNVHLIDSNKIIFEQLTGKSTQSISFIKEKRFLVIKKIVNRLKILLDRLKTSNNDVTQNLLKSIRETMEKLSIYLEKNFITQSISDKLSQIIFDNENKVNNNNSNGSNKIMDFCDCNLVVPRSLVFHSKETNIDTIKVTERLQQDIIKMKQKLDRYQSRYKSLKEAVLCNKYQFKKTREIIH